MQPETCEARPRRTWGWQFMETGWDTIHNIAKVTSFFDTLGVPFPGANAHFAAGLELVGSVLLILGSAEVDRAASLTINMRVAYATADREVLFSGIFRSGQRPRSIWGHRPERRYAGTTGRSRLSSQLHPVDGPEDPFPQRREPRGTSSPYFACARVAGGR